MQIFVAHDNFKAFLSNEKVGRVIRGQVFFTDAASLPRPAQLRDVSETEWTDVARNFYTTHELTNMQVKNVKKRAVRKYTKKKTKAAQARASH